MYTGQWLEAYFIAKNGKLQLFLRRRGHFGAWRAFNALHQQVDDRRHIVEVPVAMNRPLLLCPSSSATVGMENFRSVHQIAGRVVTSHHRVME